MQNNDTLDLNLFNEIIIETDTEKPEIIARITNAEMEALLGYRIRLIKW